MLSERDVLHLMKPTSGPGGDDSGLEIPHPKYDSQSDKVGLLFAILPP
jgi:hypothetical protein